MRGRRTGSFGRLAWHQATHERERVNIYVYLRCIYVYGEYNMYVYRDRPFSKEWSGLIIKSFLGVI